MTLSIAHEIERYLRTRATDDRYAAWASPSDVDRAQQAREDLRGALLAEVMRRSAGAVSPHPPRPEATVALTRHKTNPRVRDLFPRAEQDTMLALFERSVVFLSPDTFGMSQETSCHAASKRAPAPRGGMVG